MLAASDPLNAATGARHGAKRFHFYLDALTLNAEHRREFEAAASFGRKAAPKLASVGWRDSQTACLPLALIPERSGD